MASPSGHSGTCLPSAPGSHTIGRETFLISCGGLAAAAQLTPNASKTEISADWMRFKAWPPGTGRNATRLRRRPSTPGSCRFGAAGNAPSLVEDRMMQTRRDSNEGGGLDEDRDHRQRKRRK